MLYKVFSFKETRISENLNMKHKYFMVKQSWRLIDLEICNDSLSGVREFNAIENEIHHKIWSILSEKML